MNDLSRFICGDCMDYLPYLPDKCFDLAVVDPPYFSGPEQRGYYGRRVSPIGVKRHYYRPSDECNGMMQGDPLKQSSSTGRSAQ